MRKKQPPPSPYDYVPTIGEWNRMSKNERLAVAARYVKDADARRHHAYPEHMLTMAQQQARDLLQAAGGA